MTKKYPKFRSCSKCDNGYIYSKNVHDEDVVIICQCLLKYNNKIKLIKKLEEANINSSIIDYDISTYIGKDENENILKFKKFINNFEKVFYDKVLYIYGNTGTQKTTISHWIGRELLKKDISVYYVLMNDLIKDLQDNNFEEEQDLESKYYDCDCLIIDRAFSKDQITIYKSGYQIPFLDNFLRKRIDQLQKSTIIISNIEVDEIAKNKFNADIQNLIYRKVVPNKCLFHFKDNYTIKDDFDSIDLWGEC